MTKVVTGTYDEDGNRTRYHDDDTINREVHLDVLAAEAADLRAGYPASRWTCDCGASHTRGTLDGLQHRCLRCGFIGVGGTLDDEKRVRSEVGAVPAVEPVLAEAVEACGDPEELVLLVHPLHGDSVLDALRRHFETAGAGTVTVATADGPRDVGVPAALAGVRVFESTLIPAGEIRIAPSAAVLAGVLKVTL